MNFRGKLKDLYWPFLRVELVLAISYGLFNRVVFAPRPDLLPQIVADFFIPAFLCIGLAVWQLSSGLRKYPNSRGTAPAMIAGIAGLIMTIPVSFGSQLLVIETSTLAEMRDVMDVNPSPISRYYSFRNYFVDTSHKGVLSTYLVAGKNRESLNLKCFVASPISVSIPDSTRRSSSFWVLRKYSKTVRNPRNWDADDRLLKEFSDKSLDSFRKDDPNRFSYLERTGFSNDREDFRRAINHSSLVHYADAIIFVPAQTPFSQRGWFFVKAFLIAFAGVNLLWLLLVSSMTPAEQIPARSGDLF